MADKTTSADLSVTATPLPNRDEISAELMTTVLACEAALDALAFVEDVRERGPIRDTVHAARAHIAHVKEQARLVGVWKP